MSQTHIFLPFPAPCEPIQKPTNIQYVYVHIYIKALYIIATNIRRSLPITKSHAEQKHQQVSLLANCVLAAEGSTAEGWKRSWKPEFIPLFYYSVKYRAIAQFNKVSIILNMLKRFRGKEPCCHFTFVSTLESTWLLISHCSVLSKPPTQGRTGRECVWWGVVFPALSGQTALFSKLSGTSLESAQSWPSLTDLTPSSTVIESWWVDHPGSPPLWLDFKYFMTEG